MELTEMRIYLMQKINVWDGKTKEIEEDYIGFRFMQHS
jgi:hypothetical protein